jgi:hypothetical protein
MMRRLDLIKRLQPFTPPFKWPTEPAPLAAAIVSAGQARRGLAQPDDLPPLGSMARAILDVGARTRGFLGVEDERAQRRGRR